MLASETVSGNLTAESDPTGLDEKEKRPLWPYRKAARQKGLPIGIIDSNIHKDPGHTHPETFGSDADDLYTTEEEFRTLILPVLEGTLKPEHLGKTYAATLLQAT